MAENVPESVVGLVAMSLLLPSSQLKTRAQVALSETVEMELGRGNRSPEASKVSGDKQLQWNKEGDIRGAWATIIPPSREEL